METLLIVEDDIGIQKQLKWSFTNYNVVLAGDRSSAIAALRRYAPPVVTLDLGLPPDEDNASEGLATLREILKLSPKTKVIVITGNDEKENALKAIELGAHDFYHKPIDSDILTVIVNRAFGLATLEKENENLKSISLEQNGFVGSSPQIEQVCRLVERIAETEVTTLLLGESGTGKEVLARAIHQQSLREDKPFVAINCASIPKICSKVNYSVTKKAHLRVHIKLQRARLSAPRGDSVFR